MDRNQQQQAIERKNGRRIDFEIPYESDHQHQNQNQNQNPSIPPSLSRAQSYVPSAPAMPETYVPDRPQHSSPSPPIPNYNNGHQSNIAPSYGQVSNLESHLHSSSPPPNYQNEQDPNLTRYGTNPQSHMEDRPHGNNGQQQQQFHVPTYGQLQPNPQSFSGSSPPPNYHNGQVSSHVPTVPEYQPHGGFPPPNYHSGQQFHAPNYGQVSSYAPPTYDSSPPPPNYNSGQQQQQYHVPGYGHYGQSSFPPGTHPEVIRSFQMVDKDGSGYIDDHELQQALSSGYRRFSLGTIHLLMFLFRNPNDSLRTGPKEFASLWSCLGHWRAIFERFDRDRSGKIDILELRDALYSLGYAIPPSVLQVLISKYDDQSGRRVELDFDSFIECGMIVKGLTEKFKEKDSHYTGSATFTYDAFMSMVIPFLVSYN